MRSLEDVGSLLLKHSVRAVQGRVGSSGRRNVAAQPLPTEVRLFPDILSNVRKSRQLFCSLEIPQGRARHAIFITGFMNFEEWIPSIQSEELQDCSCPEISQSNLILFSASLLCFRCQDHALDRGRAMNLVSLTGGHPKQRGKIEG